MAHKVAWLAHERPVKTQAKMNIPWTSAQRMRRLGIAPCHQHTSIYSSLLLRNGSFPGKGYISLIYDFHLQSLSQGSFLVTGKAVPHRQTSPVARKRNSPFLPLTFLLLAHCHSSTLASRSRKLEGLCPLSLSKQIRTNEELLCKGSTWE